MTDRGDRKLLEGIVGQTPLVALGTAADTAGH
ncbi:hypothetical protein ABIB56_000326 [Glaciihabitans sp. UYNi722]